MEFGGTDRYEVLQRIGAGSFGVVYAARDRQRGDSVALKTLRHLDSVSLYRFKQEFRSLTDVAHPNLVSLYELVSDGDTWFFTMELVDGVDFLTYLRGGTTTAADAYASTVEKERLAERAHTTLPFVRGTPVRDVPRLRAAFRQLAKGVCALHSAGKLHRDIKPSNILVSRRGRVVLLDFGLVKDLGPAQTIDEEVMGSVAYMAPEQAVGEAVGEPADWYSVGVILYEALVGQLPFYGRRLKVLIDKQSQLPPPPASLATGVPDDLSALCMRLLSPDPRRRPRGPAVLRWLSDGEETTVSIAVPSTAEPFVGRAQELLLLAEAFDASRDGHAVTVQLHGRSGMGKSALIQRFLARASFEGRAVILAGRSYERESVPYKALDSLIDALCRYLLALEPHRVEALLPRDAASLARLFPVLGRIAAVADAARTVRAEPEDPQEARRRGAAALRELLARLADRVPLVLVLDDLQWGDTDSARLLFDVLRPPDPPALLLLACYRAEEVERSPFLRELSRAGQRLGSAQHQLEVGPLPPSEGRELALTLLGQAAPEPLVDAIVREAEGSPFFISELVRYLQQTAQTDDPSLGSEVRLERVLMERIRRLPPRARRLLDVVALAGAPTTEVIAARAATLDGPTSRATFTLLRTMHLLRTPAARSELAECYHDRIRETVVDCLPAETRQNLHHELARAHVAAGEADPETLAYHFEGAGLLLQAGTYALEAAERAMTALAFDRAAALYRRALELTGPLGQERCELVARQARALALAGRAREAALAYLEAATGADESRATDCRRLASEQFLHSGHIDEGLEVMRQVAPAIGVRMPPGQRQAMLAIPYWRGRLRLRGLSFVERDASQLPPEQLGRFDAAIAMGRGMGNVDPVRTALFHAQAVLLALELGEPLRVLDAFSGEVMLSACSGVSGQARTASLMERLREVAERIRHQGDDARARLARGKTRMVFGFAYHLGWGHFRKALTHLDEGAELLSGCAGRTWDVDHAQLYALDALTRLGELAELARRVEAQLRRAEQRGNRLVRASTCCFSGHLSWLAADRPADLRRTIDEILGEWSTEGFHLQHLWALCAHTHADLYQGNTAAAYHRLRQRWRGLARSHLTRVQLIRTDLWWLRGRVLLAAVLAGLARTGELRAVEACARRLDGEGLGRCRAVAALLRAGAAALRGNPPRSAELLQQAERGFAASEMALLENVTRQRRGALVGGGAGKRLIAEAQAYFETQQVANPERMVGLWAPGWD